LLLDPAQYPEPDSVPLEQWSGLRLPASNPSDAAQAAASFAGYPFMDQLTLSFALEGLKQMRLGAGQARTCWRYPSLQPTPSRLAGPDSREIHDQILRLDRYLGAFLDTLFTLRDSAGSSGAHV
jgi:hypothetical protein